jgi:SAM-dependent methyltransferase
MATSAATAAHWDGRYATVGSQRVSWFQEAPEPSLGLVTKHAPAPLAAAAIVDVGGGASRLADALLAAGARRLTVVDLSRVALEELAARAAAAAVPPGALTTAAADMREWAPPGGPGSVDVWHDRAAFHFLTDAGDQAAYLRHVAAALRPGTGVAVVGTFAPDGPPQCSGLPVARYSPEQLAAALARTGDLDVVETLRHVHVTPSGGSQPFTWVVARRRPAPPTTTAAAN